MSDVDFEGNPVSRPAALPVRGAVEKTEHTVSSFVLVIPIADQADWETLSAAMGYNLGLPRARGASVNGHAPASHLWVHTVAMPAYQRKIEGADSSGLSQYQSIVHWVLQSRLDASLDAEEITQAQIDALRANCIISGHGAGQSSGMDHVQEVLAANGLQVI